MTTRLEQLEQETEQSRTDLSRALRELKSRMTLGQMLDDAIDYFHDGDVAAMASNLRRQAVENPIALTLLGVSLAWLISPKSASTTSTKNSTSRALRKVKNTALDTGERLSSGVHAMAEKARSVGSRIADASETIADAVTSSGETVSTSYDELAQSTKAASAGARRQIASISKREPWLLVALGLAIVATVEATSRKEPRRY